MENFSQGYAFSLSLVEGTQLCRAGASWVLENYLSGDATADKNLSSLMPFASFGRVWFEESGAVDTAGTVHGMEAADTLDMVNGSTICTPNVYSDRIMYLDP